jgi:hypothetical protein
VTPKLATSWLGLPFPAGPFATIRRVVEVRLDGRRRSPQMIRDLSVRQTLRVTEVPCQRNRAATLDHTTIRPFGCHTVQVSRPSPTLPRGTLLLVAQRICCRSWSGAASPRMDDRDQRVPRAFSHACAWTNAAATARRSYGGTRAAGLRYTRSLPATGRRLGVIEAVVPLEDAAARDGKARGECTFTAADAASARRSRSRRRGPADQRCRPSAQSRRSLKFRAH